MTRLLYAIIIVCFLDTFVQLPIITPYAIGLGASHALAGSIVAVYSLTNMLGNVVGGHWIDQFGRKRMLLVGLCSVAVVLFFYPAMQSGPQLFVIRMLHGLAGGILIPAAFAYIGDRTSKKTRGKAMAFTGASIGTAAIAGPAFGGIMTSLDKVEWVFIIIGILFLLSALLVVKFIPESFTLSERGKVSVGDFVPLLKNPGVIQASLAAFALMISNGTLAFALPLQVEAAGLAPGKTGMLLTIFGLMALVVFLSPLNRVFERVRFIPLIFGGLVLISLGLFMLQTMASLNVGIVAMLVYGTGFAFVFPSMNQLVAAESQKVDRGKAYGIFYAFFSLGAVAGSAMSGAISEAGRAPFATSAFVMLLGAVLLVILSALRRPHLLK
ncbi:MFS transporter [Aciduricibacillus chroicocephali]|uniref:MFS transporter n=1 Tax=Aciduricibacillus chroicocephali TaxID=3054939 RepID=A0ABY9KWW7_9BACI|nr:MFS transporter [Bacillaceae bacterium 44XB]